MAITAVIGYTFLHFFKKFKKFDLRHTIPHYQIRSTHTALLIVFNKLF